jgi:Ca2+-binding EF-hand superfamily protein
MKLLPTLALAATFLSTQAWTTNSIAASVAPNITRQQALERADRLFQELDLNHDGLLTRAEAQQAGARLMALRAATGRDVAPGIGGHTLRFFERTFSASQSVTRPQFERAMLMHFDQMDRDHDGVLTLAERQVGRAERTQ